MQCPLSSPHDTTTELADLRVCVLYNSATQCLVWYWHRRPSVIFGGQLHLSAMTVVPVHPSYFAAHTPPFLQ